MARGDCNITNICIPTRRIIYAAGFTPPAPPPPGCNFPEGSFAQGGEICDWGYRVRWDIDPAQVPSDQTNYLAYIDLAELTTDLSPGNNALFWNDANRAEFRVTTSDGATEIPHYTSALNTVNETGYIWALVPTVSSSVTTSLFIYFANPAATEYAVGHALGRNATFAGYAAIWDFEQDPAGTAPQATDLTGNGNDGVMSGIGAAVWEAGKVGRQWRLNGTNQYITFGQALNPALNSFTLGGWFAWTAATGLRGIIGKTEGGSAAGRYTLQQRGVAGTPTAANTRIGAVDVVQDGGPYNNGVSRYLQNRTTRGTGVDLMLNGASVGIQGNTDVVSSITSTLPFDIGVFRSSTLPANYNDIRTSLAFIAFTAFSTNRLATEYNNQNAPATFATFTNFQAST